MSPGFLSCHELDKTHLHPEVDLVLCDFDIEYQCAFVAQPSPLFREEVVFGVASVLCGRSPRLSLKRMLCCCQGFETRGP